MSMGMVNKNTAATIPAAGNTGDKVGNLAALHTTVKSDIVAAVNEVKDEQANKADMDIVADAFNAAETYAEGDYCTYEGGLYKFKTAHEGAWDAADVDQIKIAGELSELKNTLTDMEDVVVDCIQRTKVGTTLSTLISAINAIKAVDISKIDKIIINNAYIVIPQQTGGACASIALGRISLNGFILSVNEGTFKQYEYRWDGTSATSTDISVTAWTIYYHGAEVM